jgi:hypothetical protein
VYLEWLLLFLLTRCAHTCGLIEGIELVPEV